MKRFALFCAGIATALVVGHWFSAGQDNIVNPVPETPTTSFNQ